MDDRTLRVLEFDWVRTRLQQLCATLLGEELAQGLVPEVDFGRVEELQQETAEARLLLREGGVGLRGVVDFRPSVQRACLGGILDGRQLVELWRAARAGRLAKAAVTSRADRLPVLAALARDLPTFELLEARFERSLSEEGQVLDGASAHLAKVRREIRATQERLRAQLEEIVRSPRWSRMLQDPIVTVRGDRYVVPVKQAYAAQFPGVVHDQSATGATLFMEPLVALQLGNRLRQLQGEEAREVERVLAELSSEVASRKADWERLASLLARLDFALAKAALAEELDAVRPVLVPRPLLDLRAARHPILVERSGRHRSPVVPVDVRLGEDFRTLVITGPNTGGKTVTLKTVGLLTLMAQAGLAIPARDGSRAGCFSAVFADIGDEQSIQQNLSTFSSHMRTVVEVVRRAGPGCLVLLDEVGAGTDPAEGCALARAVVETLHERGACTVVTTHYGELKTLAYQLDGVENASVEFDAETLQPTYRLRIGTPGRSNALVIASRLGLEEAVVARARSYLRRDLQEADALLEGVERDRRAAELDRQEAERMRAELEVLRAGYEERLRRLEETRRQLLDRAREEARQVVDRARREVETVLEALRTERRERAAEQARRRLQALVESLQQARQPPGPPLERVEVGQAVRVASLGAEGLVVGVSGELAEVQVGSAKVRVPRSELRAPAAASTAAAPDRRRWPEPPRLAAKLDLRGLPADEAVARLEKYLDDAVLAGAHRVLVVHGRGTGALRRAVHEVLRTYPGVRFSLANPGEGGDGATVVEFTE
ncbi:MAG: endonuclease MutS2 [Armatimonadota bacterium]|nr:endonuclease MutS2 [Armatimonadota bacterium]MDW8156253.1 endonuclease MutS2 [Armatimonadota bacterium]